VPTNDESASPSIFQLLDRRFSIVCSQRRRRRRRRRRLAGDNA